MMRIVLILAAVAVALLAVLALTRGGPRRGAVEVAAPTPVEAPATPVPAVQAAPKAAAAAPAEPEVSGVDDDAAATGMTTREAAPADQAAETPVEKKEP